MSISHLRQLCFVLEVFKALSQDRVPPLVVDIIFLSLLGGDALRMRLAVCTVGMCTRARRDGHLQCQGEEDEEDEDEEDEDMDEICAESRFPAGFLPMRMCRWFPSGNCRQGWGCMFAHSVSELHPLARGQGP